MRAIRIFGLALATLAVCTASAPRIAEACGGTFCDTGPQAMPVDQTGENIVFVIEAGKVEAHIQIQYRGDAPRFSWVLPVPKLPEVEVGCQALFDRLLAATVPTYGFSTQQDFCGNGPSTPRGAGDTTGSTTTGAGGSGPGENPPVVVLHQTVGAFDVTVLQGGTSDEVLNWLMINGYQTAPNASPLFQAYVDKGYLFVAVKLTGGAGVDEIHPLVVRYEGAEPCVPIKLTAVAAAEDMGIRTFFLGTKRVVPKNFKHVVPNPVKLDWFNSSSAYANFVGRSADSPVANGQAFVTEYAGSSAVVSQGSIASPSWNAAPFATVNPVGVIDLLENQQLVSCYGGSCTYTNPLLLPLLREYLPAPATLTANGMTVRDPALVEGYFYSCLACYQPLIDLAKWNGSEFASKLASRIIDPARHADQLLASWPYLTRMFTTMSPAEMTLDPDFQERDGLPDVNLVRATATRRITCDGASAMILPDGRNVALAPLTSSWPSFSDMPWAQRIEEFQATDNTVVLVDNTQRINDQLKLWNDSQHWPIQTTGSGGSAGANAANPSITDNGCACRTAAATSSTRPPWALFALFGLAAARRRKRV